MNGSKSTAVSLCWFTVSVREAAYYSRSGGVRMQSIEVELEGQKQDERGRQIRSPEEWAKLIELYHQSGLTQKAFAKHEGLNIRRS